MFRFPRFGFPLLTVMVAVLLSGCGEPTPSESIDGVMDDTAVEHALKHADSKYVCPMHSQIIRDEEGSCPICGMDLVKKDLGVRIAAVARRTMWRYIKTVGTIQFDETRLAHVHPRAEGWMEKLHVRSVGERVKRGQVLGDLYSPEVLSAQVDFLIALKQSSKSGSTVRIDKARNLLRLLDVPESVISSIKDHGETRNTVPLLAPIDGVVTLMGAREGMYVKPGTQVYSIVDLSEVWVQVDVFEHQIAWLEVGQTAEMKVPAYPGKVWQGKVDYIYPELDAMSRTLRVRLVFPNTEGLLKPNMFADVEIFGGPRHGMLAIPNEALIETGEREAVVRSLGDGRFRPVDVVTGGRQGGYVEILKGLAEGDQVVISGQFLIDSESSLQASFNRIDASE
jgi:Cu(I)/Ag(I) efflux system membrane fusion protein